MKVRDNDDRLEFATWPTDRITMETLRVGPRGSGWYGSLGSSPVDRPLSKHLVREEHRIDAGIPVLGQLLQLYVDTPITSNLLLSSEKGAIWYHQALWKETRFCGTPKISIDSRQATTSGRWWPTSLASTASRRSDPALARCCDVLELHCGRETDANVRASYHVQGCGLPDHVRSGPGAESVLRTCISPRTPQTIFR